MKNIPTKEEYFKKFRSNPDYQAILKAAPAHERKQIINTVERVAATMLEALSMLAVNANQDPAASQQIIEALKTGDGIIKESDGAPINSKHEPEEK
jgi:hypothetical protein